jgi:very-short-patch-repair endonuclease
MSNIRTNNLQDQNELRKELRNNGTPAEGRMWLMLKNRQIKGKKFRRQFSVGNFVLDFYCAELKLAIELDGAPHFTSVGVQYDEEREKYLLSQGIKVLRYENKMVFEDPEGIVDDIKNTIKQIEDTKYE